MRFCYSIFIFAALWGCAKYNSKFDRKFISYVEKPNARTSIPVLNDSTLLINAVSDDEAYAYSASKPVMLGMLSREEGAGNVPKYLNALTGSNNEEIFYERYSPCCPFKTVNGANEKNFKTDYGLLERYKVYHSGLKDTLVLYLNLYDEGQILIPKGFKTKGD